MHLRKLLFIFLIIVLLLIAFLVFRSKGALPAVLPPKEVPKSEVVETQLGLKIPAGFKIDIFATDLVGPRVETFDQQSTLLTSIPSEGKVVALPDKNNDGKADSMITLVANLDRPHGLAIKDGKLYVAQVSNVLAFDYDSQNLKVTNQKSVVDLPPAGRHFTRTIRFGPDGKLYIAVGSTCDVCVEKDERNGTILQVDSQTGQSQIFAKGLRNSVFFTFDPQTAKIWATEMGRDFLGDNLPPDEINIIEEGKDYGWPFCYGRQVHDINFDKKVYVQIVPQPPCGQTEPPIYEIPAHSAPLGLVFITSSHFPDDWQDDLLVAYHGSWNRSTPSGYKIVRLKINDEKVISEEDFISGFLPASPTGEQGTQTIGRPVDLIFDKEGSLYISDDKAGVIYKLAKR